MKLGDLDIVMVKRMCDLDINKLMKLGDLKLDHYLLMSYYTIFSNVATLYSS